jgi:TolB-like protein/DNA-binding winged helix-turn-helix (wHTH) protein/tetratricopeptide (TPR) repeat protein
LTRPPPGGEQELAFGTGAALNFRFADFEIDVARHELRRAGIVVHIEPQVFDLLVYLVRHRERTVSKDELIDSIWQGRIVSDATLSSRISAARRALGDSGNDQSLIRTLHKRGFRFVGEAREIDADDAAPTAMTREAGPPTQGAVEERPTVVQADAPLAPDDSAVALLPPLNAGGDPDRQDVADQFPAAAASPSSARPSQRNRMLAVAAIGLAASFLVAGWWLLRAPSASTSQRKDFVLASSADAPSAERLKTPVASIVVLPFANLSGDASREYLTDGITDSLISDLARALPGIGIVSRETAFTYKGRAVDARQIGRDLGVRYLLEGSVLLGDERIRVNTRLVETREGSQLWAERVDTERKSILQFQDEIVARVSRAMGLQVINSEARRSLHERPDSAELTDLIMRGKAVLNMPSSAATMADARALFEQALKLEPNHADALAGIASTLVFEFLNGYPETDDGLHRAELLLDASLRIYSRHLMSLKAKAALHRAQGRFEDAILAAQAIIMENPGEPWAYKEIGLSTLYLGKPEQALDWFAKAERIGPRDPARWTWLDSRGHALILLGRDEEAVRALIAALDANPGNVSSHAFLAAAYALLGRGKEARTALAAYVQKHPGARISTFRTRSPVPLALTDPKYQQQRARVNEGLRKAGMPE